MKHLLFTICLFQSLLIFSQTKKPLIISRDGIDALKIGMSKAQIENVIDDKLDIHRVLDSMVTKDITTPKWPCNDCNEFYVVKYKGIEFSLVFLRLTMSDTLDFELAAISPINDSGCVQSSTGIKKGITERKFMKICRKNNYRHELAQINKSDKVGYFVDDLKKNSSKIIMLKIKDGIVTSLSVANMIGD